eukprot:NODE_1948_length_1029_cov_171.668378.p1 GENE.NODE_1948_length_1029_cov_171.668378~~NODE_1948_length_1029_cov_171.668378.p1  ORF type:complete len:222 (+),score=53.75 NODE_1948_length_1029_cov_171.668378:3-668(+)
MGTRESITGADAQDALCGDDTEDVLLPLHRFMDPAPYTLVEDMPALRFYPLFAKSGITAVAVVSRAGVFRGILSRFHLLSSESVEHGAPVEGAADLVRQISNNFLRDTSSAAEIVRNVSSSFLGASDRSDNGTPAEQGTELGAPVSSTRPPTPTRMLHPMHTQRNGGLLPPQPVWQKPSALNVREPGPLVAAPSPAPLECNGGAADGDADSSEGSVVTISV